jgi:DNA-directed RNA polymerase sigma subunit (sigma70/sigma32)
MSARPADVIDTINRLVRVSRNSMRETGREPSSDELARMVGLSTEKIDRLLEIARMPIRFGR